MLNYIWLGLILAAVLIGGYNDVMDKVTTAAFDSARTAVMTLALPLAGLMALWLGIMRLAEKSGFIHILASGIRPLMRWLFPEVPANHPANGAMIMNLAANMLGLSNAATPLGLKAMKHLETLSPQPGVATNAMCTFLVLNTSSVQLIAATTVGLLAAAGSVMPTAFIPTALAASFCATVAGIAAVKFLEKLPMYRMPDFPAGPAVDAEIETTGGEDAAALVRPPPLHLWKKTVLVLLLLFFVFLFLAQLFPQIDPRGAAAAGAATPGLAEAGPEGPFYKRVVDAIALLAIPFILAFFTLFAALSRVNVYEEFVEGAKEGFHIAVRIIPYLVAILVAIGMFRASEGMALLETILSPLLTALHFPVDVLPIAVMRPLSGSGTLGLLSDLITTHGPDSLIARIGATIAGSTETTFYVLAVYFGSVGIRRTRHAVPAGLFADAVGITAAVIIATLVFG
jgi:spore maturation protein SpmA